MFGLTENPSEKPPESLIDLILQSSLYPPIPMIPLKDLVLHLHPLYVVMISFIHILT